MSENQDLLDKIDALEQRIQKLEQGDTEQCTCGKDDCPECNPNATGDEFDELIAYAATPDETDEENEAIANFDVEALIDEEDVDKIKELDFSNADYSTIANSDDDSQENVRRLILN